MRITNIHGKVWLALKARLDEWDETTIHYPFGQFAPEADQAFLVIDPVDLDVDIASLDYDCGEERRGFLNVRVMTPMAWDYAATTGLMGRFADMFPAGWQGQYEDATVQVWREAQATGIASTEFSWHRRDVRIYWRCWG